MDDTEGKRLGDSLGGRAPKIAYKISANASSFTGIIAPENFEIIPLYYEKGKLLLNQLSGAEWKDPRNPNSQTSPTAFDNNVPLANFVLEMRQGDRLVWNIIGNNTSGATF